MASTVISQAPLSMGFPRQEYWSGLLFPPPGIFLTRGLNPHLLHLLYWQAGSLPLVPPGKPQWLALCDMTNAWLYRIPVHHRDGWEGQLWLQGRDCRGTGRVLRRFPPASFSVPFYTDGRWLSAWSRRTSFKASLYQPHCSIIKHVSQSSLKSNWR